MKNKKELINRKSMDLIVSPRVKKNKLVLININNSKRGRLIDRYGGGVSSFNGLSSLKSICLLITFFIIIFLTMSNISAIGITPGRTTFNFEPGMQQEIPFSIVNTEHKDMSVVFILKGELAEYITLKQTFTKFTSEEGSKSFSYVVNLPSDIREPGLHEGEIVALEMPEDLGGAGAFVGATVSVASQLHVYVAYPDKYVDAQVNIVEGDEGSTVFLIPIINRGELGIVNVRATIDIYTALNEKITTLETNSQSLNSLERKELAVSWNENINPGKYFAVITILYDNEVLKLEKEFNVGKKILDILEVVVRDFSLGEIAKFNALVENKWAEELKEVFLNILVYNPRGDIMADFKSPTYDIPGLSKSEMVAYWDTGGVSEGTYDGKLILKYGKASTDKNIQMKISDDSLEVIGITGHVLVKSGEGFNLNNMLLILVIFLVLVNIIWFLVVRRLLTKKKSPSF